MSNKIQLREIFKIWWPLAASWMLMGLELPALSAVVARLQNPDINLAAYGGVVFPLALIIEAPIIMLLAASTALSKDWPSYTYVRKFMMWAGALLTALHMAIAFTPLYDFVVGTLISAPEEIIEPARIGLMIMTPWTWSIAYRRFNQGVLIRFGHSNAVGIGSVIRLIADAIVLIIGYIIGDIPGIIVATAAVSSGVISEAVYIGFRVRPVLLNELMGESHVNPALDFPTFINFYVPLALTSLLLLAVQPIGSAALSRMPRSIESLAIWPVVSGLVFLLRSMGVAYNEVVVAVVDRPNTLESLRRFTLILTIFLTAIMLMFTVTPLAGIWFRDISALRPELALIAKRSMWFALFLPALSTLQSHFQGLIVNSKKTRAVTESIVIFLIIIMIVLIIGIQTQEYMGIYVGLLALAVGMVFQTIWLYIRSRWVVRELVQLEK